MWVYIVGMRYFIFLCISLVIAAKVAAYVGHSLSARMEKVLQIQEERIAIEP
jgi:hypothetical protein